jgi:hypothetical protein
MPGISLERLAEKTRVDRFRMKVLMELKGLEESKALGKILPKDSNRTRKLDVWKEKGLWPVSDSEIQEHRTLYNTVVAQADPKAPQIEASQQHITQDVTHITQFDDATVEALKEIVTWWRERKEEPTIPVSAQYPQFKKSEKPHTRSIRIDAALLKAAEQKAKIEKSRTGGNFNSLVNVLIWQFLGCPKEFIEEES